LSKEEYWIGRGVDYEGVWRSYRDGLGYVDKFVSMRVHLLRIEFDQPPRTMPLFNHEAIYKTLKGYFHDLKQTCFSREEYAMSGPLFLYSIDRGSGIWNLLGELRQLIMLGSTLADEKVMGQKIDNLDKRLMLLRKHFGDAFTPEEYYMFMKAKTPRELDKAVQELLKQRIIRVQISRAPFVGNIESTEKTLVDLKKILDESNDR